MSPTSSRFPLPRGEGRGEGRRASLLGSLLALLCLLPSSIQAQPETRPTPTLELLHEDRLGADGAWELRSVEYVLDGQPLATRSPEHGGGTEPSTHPLTEGRHVLGVRAVYEGRSPVFSYVQGYRFVMQGTVRLDARAGYIVRITSTGFEREGLTLQWQQRPAFELAGEPRQAILGIEYGPLEHAPLAPDEGAEAAAARVVDEVLAEAGRLAPVSPRADPTACALEPLYFAFSDTRLSDEATAVLHRVADCFMKQPGLRLRIQGHTDVRGTESYNAGLGQGRAQTVGAYLLSLGMAREQLLLETEAGEHPPCTERTEACFARSRRVELVAESSGP